MQLQILVSVLLASIAAVHAAPTGPGSESTPARREAQDGANWINFKVGDKV
jgi:hypothetical protein